MTYIRRFIFKLPLNRIFTTREVLVYGTRSTVDQSLGRLVNKGYIVRLTRGVFIREGSKQPTPFEVAKAKCLAYCKQISKHGAAIAAELNLIEIKNQEATFTTTGRSSAFWFGNIRIIIKGISHRKMLLNQNKIGKPMAALWYLGKQLCELKQIRAATRNYDRGDRQESRLLSPIVPGWLDKFFDKHTYPMFIERQNHSIFPECVQLGLLSG